MTKRVHVMIERTFPTYTRLRGVSWDAFQSAEENEVSRLYHRMTSMLFSAFTIEAYLNHLGGINIPHWDILKEKLSPKDKLEYLSGVFHFMPDFGRRPFQTFHKIFKLRNLLVHAKTETLIEEGEFILADGESPPKPLTEWEQLISSEGVKLFFEDTKRIIEKLGVASGEDPTKIFDSEVIVTTTKLLSDSNMPST